MRNTDALFPILLDAAHAAALLGISRSHFHDLCRRGYIGPIPINLGRSVRFSRFELEAWVKACCPCRQDWQLMLKKEEE